MTYPQWWERLLAAVIDGLVLLIPAVLVNLLFGAMAGRSVLLAVVLGLVASIVIVAGIVAYKVILEAGPRQATVGKMVLGLQVTTFDSQRMSLPQAFIRTWPWWIGLLNFLTPVPILGILVVLLILAVWIGVLVSVLIDPNGIGIHDKSAKCMVVKTGKGMLA